jgi:hypothetical protein
MEVQLSIAQNYDKQSFTNPSRKKSLSDLGNFRAGIPWGLAVRSAV